MPSNIPSDLIEVCVEQGKAITGLLHNDQPVNGGRLLLTLSALESNYGKLREFVRYEKGYAPGGKYFSDSETVRALYRKYGCLACSSFGTFQLMFVTARELGFTDHPIRLQEDRVCAYWATQLITQRFIKRLRAQSLKDILDCYNSGYHRDHYIPTKYIESGIQIYDELQSV